MRADGNGKPITFLVTAGQRHEAVAFEQLLERGAIKREGKGRPKLRPKRVVGDKGYSSGKLRRYLRRKGIRLMVPRRANERRMGPFDREVYAERNRVERLINRLKRAGSRGAARPQLWSPSRSPADLA